MYCRCNARVLSAPLTGVQRYTTEILRRLPDSQVQCHTPPQWLRRPFDLLWEQGCLPLYMHKGDMLWSPANRGPLWVRRQCVTVHDLAPIEYPEEFSWLYRKFYSFLLPRLLPRVAGIITVSEYSRQRILTNYPVNPENVHAIPLAVDHNRFKAQKADAIANVRRKLNLPARYILFLGEISKRKNLGQLIRAFSKVQCRVGPDVELVIAGGASAKHVFTRNGIPNLPSRCLFTGRIDEADLAPLLAGADVFVFPSLYEGFGLPPLEAMACGAPCITSNVTSLPEVVGDAAVLISPYDDDALAQALEAVLTNPNLASRLRDMGLARAGMFSWEKTAAETWRVLTKNTGGSSNSL